MYKVSVTKSLTDSQVNEILDIVINSSEIDGARPFSEHVEIHLRSGGDRPVIHLLAEDSNNKIVAIIDNINKGIDIVQTNITGTSKKLHKLGWIPKYSIDNIVNEIINS